MTVTWFIDCNELLSRVWYIICFATIFAWFKKVRFGLIYVRPGIISQSFKELILMCDDWSQRTSDFHAEVLTKLTLTKEVLEVFSDLWRKLRRGESAIFILCKELLVYNTRLTTFYRKLLVIFCSVVKFAIARDLKIFLCCAEGWVWIVSTNSQ